MVAAAQQVQDSGQVNKYFALMLHIDDDDLDPFEYKLLGHYRKVCGLHGGTCDESTDVTAHDAKMSPAKVRSVRNSLKAKGCIKTKPIDGWGIAVTVCDRMSENITRYANPYQKREGLENGNPLQKHEGLESTPTKNIRGPLPKTSGVTPDEPAPQADKTDALRIEEDSNTKNLIHSAASLPLADQPSPVPSQPDRTNGTVVKDDPISESKIGPEPSILDQFKPAGTVKENIKRIVGKKFYLYDLEKKVVWLQPFDDPADLDESPLKKALIPRIASGSTFICGSDRFLDYRKGAEILAAAPWTDQVMAPDLPKKVKKPKAPKAESDPTWTEEVKNAFAVLCFGSADAWKIDTNRGQMIKALKQLSAVKPITIEALRTFYKWWVKCDWRGQKGQKPTPADVVKTWIQSQTGSCGDTSNDKIFNEVAPVQPEPWAVLNGDNPPGYYAEVA